MKQQRIHGMDFTRAVLMTLGIFYHSALIFVPNPTWAAQSPVGNEFFAVLSGFTSSFRMHAFYVIAGFFFLLIITKRGKLGAIKDRLIKLGIPLLAVGFTINFAANQLAVNYQFPNNWLDYIIDGEWLRHLWFIGNLITYCLVYLLVHELFIKLCHNRYLIPTLLIAISPLCIALVKEQSWRFGGYSNFIFVYPRNLLVFLPYFLLGIFLYHHKDAALRYITLKNFALISLAAMTLLFLGSKSQGLISTVVTEYYSMVAAIAVIMILCLIGENATGWVRNFTDASYTIYLVHSPIIIALYAFCFQGTSISIWLQYLILITVTLLLSYQFHALIVKKSAVMALLMNGQRAKKPPVHK